MRDRARRTALLGGVVLSGLLLAGCTPKPVHGTEGQGPGAPPYDCAPARPADPPAAGATEVVIDNFTYRPQTLTVPVGARVTWVNRDDVPHTATSTARPKAFDSGTLDTDQSFTHTFTAPGTYEYFCAVHPRMTGQVVVK
jgi:plastocyanin